MTPVIRSREIDAMIERQVRRWETARLSKPPPHLPVVALSRLPGARGDELAKALAAQLDYGLFDREIVDEIAREGGVAARLVAGLDERVRGVIDRYVTDVFRTRRFVESDYLEHVVRAIRTLSERGRVVIVGRGAPYLLAPREALRVLVVAPRTQRAARLAEERQLSPDRAPREFERAESERREFARYHFGVEQSDPELYDLVVNSGTMELQTAVDVVVRALERQFPVVAAAKAAG